MCSSDLVADRAEDRPVGDDERSGLSTLDRPEITTGPGGNSVGRKRSGLDELDREREVHHQLRSVQIVAQAPDPVGATLRIGLTIERVAVDEVDEGSIIERAVRVGELDASVEVLGDARERLAALVLVEPEEGATGVGAIKDVDGFSIAQEPSTAKYDGMPASAIKSGKVDLILPPDQIGDELMAISPLADRPIPEFRSGENREAYERILRLLKRDHGVNFNQYKDKTLSRRIMRRMIATKSDQIADYAELLTTDPAELTELFHDLLIGVTAFFRDTEAYADLRIHLDEYISQKSEPFLRVWSVGCSTGEEPYSIAIMLAEMLGDKLDDHRIQIFATDVNQRAIDRARRGRYSASEVSGLSKELRDKYFLFVDGHFEVTKRIKQLVVFSQHDMVQDPPFLRQDLVVCRNVMIYFNLDLQARVHGLLFESLRRLGTLCLGRGEMLHGSPHEDSFTAISDTERIYQRTR